MSDMHDVYCYICNATDNCLKEKILYFIHLTIENSEKTTVVHVNKNLNYNTPECNIINTQHLPLALLWKMM